MQPANIRCWLDAEERALAIYDSSLLVSFIMERLHRLLLYCTAGLPPGIRQSTQGCHLYVFRGNEGDDADEKKLKKINRMLGGEGFPLVYESAFALRIHLLLLQQMISCKKAEPLRKNDGAGLLMLMLKLMLCSGHTGDSLQESYRSF